MTGGCSVCRSYSSLDTQKLRPTYTHEAIAELCKMGVIKFVISQNGDSLHLLSGVPGAERCCLLALMWYITHPCTESSISELHGNVFIEYCSKCGKRFHRSFYVLEDNDECLDDPTVAWPPHIEVCDTCQNNHFTGRYVRAGMPACVCVCVCLPVSC